MPDLGRLSGAGSLAGKVLPTWEPGEGMGRRSSAGCAGARQPALITAGEVSPCSPRGMKGTWYCHAYKTPDLGPMTVEGFSWREGPAHPARANLEGGTIDVHQQHALARGARSRPNRYRARRDSSPARRWLPLRLWRPARPGILRGRRMRDQRDDGRRGIVAPLPSHGEASPYSYLPGRPRALNQCIAP
jgi:hypothetical protein